MAPDPRSSAMSRVESAFQEHQDHQDGLINAFSSDLETIVTEGKKITNTHHMRKGSVCGA
uniref:Uncharacterized protein n=1 Tax=Arundo donax TaxID=35708 RepID=A0A0A8Z949_ARUDO